MSYIRSKFYPSLAELSIKKYFSCSIILQDFPQPFLKPHGWYNSSMPNRTSPLVIGIAGGSGSGKTTLANLVRERVGADRIAYLPHDAYYKDLSDLPPNQRKEINFDHPDSLDTGAAHPARPPAQGITRPSIYRCMISKPTPAPTRLNGSSQSRSSWSRAS